MGINLGSSPISDLKMGETQVNKVYLGSDLVWQKSQPVPTLRALKFTCAGSQTLGISSSFIGTITPNFEYSTDGTTWNSWDITSSLSFGNGTDLYLRGFNESLAKSGSNYVQFVFSSANEDVECTGNLMHLLDYSQDLTSFPNSSGTSQGFKNLFRDCSSLITAPSLPATTLVPYCYFALFFGCVKLVNIPSLPATILTEGCYKSMYRGCTSLDSIPVLPATTLTSECYNEMFRGCSNLDSICSLPATTLAGSCYKQMFMNCSKIKMSASPDPSYPNTFTFGTNPNGYATNMFYGTDGTYSDSATQQTYYTSNTIIS